MRHTAPPAVDVEPELALRVFRAEINLTRRCVHTFGVNDEMVNQLLHFHQNLWFLRGQILWILHCDRSSGQLLDHLAQDKDALTHFFESDKIAAIGLSERADRDV